MYNSLYISIYIILYHFLCLVCAHAKRFSLIELIYTANYMQTYMYSTISFYLCMPCALSRGNELTYQLFYSFVMLGNFSFLNWQKLTTSFSFFSSFLCCFVFRACSCVCICVRACVCILVCCAAIFNFCRITGNMKLCIIKSNDYLSSPFWPPPSQTRTAIKNGSKYEHARTHTRT